MTITILDELVAGALEDAQIRERSTSASELRDLVDSAPSPRDVLGAFAPRANISTSHPPVTAPHIIAEVKRKSPSKGNLATIKDPAALARTYESAGATAISVLTERRRFGGSLDDLRAVRAAVSIPVLRKEFIVNEYQLLEARAFGADLALLIVAAMPFAQLEDLHEKALELGLTPLVEVHTPDEAAAAARLGARIVGVNTRDLRTFVTDRTAFAELKSALPDTAIHVAESAVKAVDDVDYYATHGAHAVLVGEALVTTGDPYARLQAFLHRDSLGTDALGTDSVSTDSLLTEKGK